jgi:hypothetical protein
MSIVNLADFPDYPRLLRGRLPSRRTNLKSGAAARVKSHATPAASPTVLRNHAGVHAQCELPLAG